MKAEAAILRGEPYNLPIEFAPKHGANGRDEGFKYFQGLIEIVIDPERCPYAARMWPMFEKKRKPNGQGWDDKPGTFGDHSPDACRYSEHENIARSEYNEDYGVSCEGPGFCGDYEDCDDFCDDAFDDYDADFDFDN